MVCVCDIMSKFTLLQTGSETLKECEPSGNRVQVSTEEVLSNCVKLLMMSHSYACIPWFAWC